MRIVVQAVNEAELFFDASIQPLGERDISLHVAINAHWRDETTEQQLARLFDAATKFEIP
jgi:hypothetical protein